MTAEFQPGDTVQLKSGGPLMTVDEVGEHLGSPAVICSWFEKTKRKNDRFIPTSLKKVDARRSAIAIQI